MKTFLISWKATHLLKEDTEHFYLLLNASLGICYVMHKSHKIRDFGLW